MMLETHMKLCVTELDFLEIFFCPKIGKTGLKWVKNRGFFNILKNFVINFY